MTVVEKMDFLQLEKDFNNVCESILMLFCKVYELPYEKDSWVAGDIGTFVSIGDYYIDFQDIIYMLKHHISFDTWLQNYDYNLDAHELGFNYINFKHWCRGCPRLSKEDILVLREKGLTNQSCEAD